MIESNKKEIQCYLMWETKKVAQFNVTLMRQGIAVNIIEIFNKDLLPVNCKLNEYSLHKWAIKRNSPMKYHKNIFFVESFFGSEIRDPLTPFVLSLSFNSISLSDKFWVNPCQENKVVLNGRTIYICPSNWDKINPFKTSFAFSDEFNDVAFKDEFLGQNINIDINSLSWTLNGYMSKTVFCENGQYFIEKELCAKTFKNEKDTLDFFKSNNILTPKYRFFLSNIASYNNFYQPCSLWENPEKESYHIIKTCLTNDRSFLVPLDIYTDKNLPLFEAVKVMGIQNNASKEQIDNLLCALKLYIQQFKTDYSHIKTDNIGLIKSGNEAIPVVWGRLVGQRNALCPNEVF